MASVTNKMKMILFGLKDKPTPSGKNEWNAVITGDTMINEITTESAVRINVSHKNCSIRFLRLQPNTLRTPISFALCNDCAVDKLMKLTAAISKINSAITIKPYSVER